jgi:CDP-2,3-bis-(O-geranylgeranyl)-sn-glycerol synthase
MPVIAGRDHRSGHASRPPGRPRLSFAVLFVSALWLAAPVIAGGALHIAAIKRNILPWLARPIDGGLRVRGHRLLGDNKTVRGALLMVLFTTLCAIAQAWITARFAWARTLAFPGSDATAPAWWGALLGTGYVLGELPNSFVKRQLKIAPGQPGRGWTRPVFWIVDQVDSLAGALIAMSFVWRPPADAMVALVVITLAVHPAAAVGMVILGLKNRVG